MAGRRALLLESAGRETLATHLGNRERLPLDLLERWGTDLLEALIALDAVGITHRDIKPANLGVHKEASSRAKHLKLFDFSLTKAPASDTQAGTRPYLDPFLTGKRQQYDSAAERFAAAVVLFEMATGHTPVYGDGLSDPASLTDEVTLEPADFDRSVQAPLIAFFATALARDAERGITPPSRCCSSGGRASRTVPSSRRTPTRWPTPRPRTRRCPSPGLTPRALSALEQLQLSSVGDLARWTPGG